MYFSLEKRERETAENLSAPSLFPPPRDTFLQGSTRQGKREGTGKKKKRKGRRNRERMSSSWGKNRCMKRREEIKKTEWGEDSRSFTRSSALLLCKNQEDMMKKRCKVVILTVAQSVISKGHQIHFLDTIPFCSHSSHESISQFFAE